MFISFYTLNSFIIWIYAPNRCTLYRMYSCIPNCAQGVPLRRIRATFTLSNLIHILAFASHLNLLHDSCFWPTNDWENGLECLAGRPTARGAQVIIARTWFTFGYLRAIRIRESIDVVEELIASPWFKASMAWTAFRTVMQALMFAFLGGAVSLPSFWQMKTLI